jgi:predicted ester cyclase
MSADRLVRHYVDSFNERRFADAAALFAPDSRFTWIPFSDPRQGQDGYAEFVERWGAAFSQAQLRIERVEQRGDRMCEVNLLATGTHIGTLVMGVFHFTPTHTNIAVPMKHVFEFVDESIVYASLSVDSQELVRQLTTLNLSALDAHLGQIVGLRSELATANGDDRRLTELADRLGRELDAARRLVRPYYRR